jgi:hypothetical protein
LISLFRFRSSHCQCSGFLPFLYDFVLAGSYALFVVTFPAPCSFCRFPLKLHIVL